MATNLSNVIRSTRAARLSSNLRPRAAQATICPCQRRNLAFHVRGRRIIVWPTRHDWPEIRNNWRRGYQQDPTGVIFAALVASGIMVFSGWYVWRELHRFKAYPEPVARKLREAIVHRTKGQPVQALEAYKEALVLAQQEDMDMFSDEVVGMKYAMARLMEDHEEYVQAITALEVVMRECLTEANACRTDPQQKKRRTRLLTRAVEIGVKLGELYARPEVWDRDAAEQRLSWAVETMVKESRRREERNMTDDEDGPWFSTEELAATIEGLADTYESKDQHYLAAPLYLHAINVHPQTSCHTVVLMNNLASSLCQQSPRAAAAVQAAVDSQAIVERAPPPVSREMLLEMGKTWAARALEVSASIKPPERNQECDIGCVVATHNLGEIAEMANDLDEAKRRYHEAISLAKAIGYQDGLEQSSKRLRRLEGRA